MIKKILTKLPFITLFATLLLTFNTIKLTHEVNELQETNPVHSNVKFDDMKILYAFENTESLTLINAYDNRSISGAIAVETDKPLYDETYAENSYKTYHFSINTFENDEGEVVTHVYEVNRHELQFEINPTPYYDYYEIDWNSVEEQIEELIN